METQVANWQNDVSIEIKGHDPKKSVARGMLLTETSNPAAE
jgi:hypothetical protein